MQAWHCSRGGCTPTLLLDVSVMKLLLTGSLPLGVSWALATWPLVLTDAGAPATCMHSNTAAVPNSCLQPSTRPARQASMHWSGCVCRLAVCCVLADTPAGELLARSPPVLNIAVLAPGLDCCHHLHSLPAQSSSLRLCGRPSTATDHATTTTSAV
jgi:hypothetical protein